MNDTQKQFDEKQVDWYELDEEGGKAVSLKDRLLVHSGLVIKILVSVVVVALVIWLLLFVVSLFMNGGDEVVDNNTRLYIESCQSADDVEQCIASAAPRLAQQTGDIEYCVELEGDIYDSCAGLAALTSLDLNDCKKIEDQEKKNNCNDALVILNLDQGYSYEDCDDLIDLERQGSCQQRWISDAITDGNCDHESISEELCSSGEMLAQAMDARDPSMCEQIEMRNIYETCIEMVGPGDKDFDGLDADEEKYRGTSDEDADSDDDGLMDYEEIHDYETDPLNPDSDGDGYSDGVEVIGGYDPLR